MEFGENLRNFEASTKEYQNLVARDLLSFWQKLYH